MKKLISTIAAAIMALALAVPAFAAAADNTIHYDVSVAGEHEITAKTGDVITVVYAIKADQNAATITTQNEIFYDNSFFALVEGSNKISSTYRGFYMTSTQAKSDGTSYVFFNTADSITYGTELAEIGSFQLKVTAQKGSSTIASTSYFANDSTLHRFGASAANLTVTIEESIPKTYTVRFVGGSGATGAAPEAMQIKAGASIAIPNAGTLARTGYSFNGWNYNGTTYEVGASFTVPESNVTFSAVWKKNDTPGGEIVIPPVGPPVIPPVVENEMRFVDVLKSDYYYDSVLWATQNSITLGADETHFAPLEITTRGQMVTFLWRAMGCPEPTAATCTFTDVKANAYYYKAVLWAIEAGITKGTSNTTFSPDEHVTRGQTVAFLARMNNVKDDATGYNHGFEDVKATDYFNNAVAWAATNRITQGTGATTFSPNENCLRGQIVTFLYRNFVK